jgi:SAM-dependent methyltransferase
MQEQQPSSPARTYEEFFGPSIFTPWSRVLLERAAPRPGERVLDLACGTGIVTRQVAPMVGPSGSVVGLDVSPDMLEVARSIPVEGAPVEWREGNASELDLPAGSFDLVLCQQGLQFFPDRAAAARGIHRVLKDGGRAVIAVWQSLDRHAVLEAIFTAESRHLQLPVEQVATPFSLADSDQLRRVLEGAGFGGVEIEEVSLDLTFPSPDRYIELTTRAGAAVIPELAQDGEALASLLASVQRDAGEIVQKHRQGDTLTFPMHAHVAVARK